MSTEQKDLAGLVEKLRQEQEFVQFYKAQIRSGVQELNKSCDNVFHSLWLCHTLSYGLSRVLSHNVAPYEWSLALDQGVEFINATKVLKSSIHVDQYSKFLSVLLTDTKLLSEILVLAESEGLDCQWLVSDLMSILYGHCLFQRDHTHFLRLLGELVTQHVKFCSSPKDVFGGVESVFTKVLVEYCSQLTELQAFLSELLHESVMEVVALDDYLEYDVSKAGSRFHASSDQTDRLVGTSTFLFSEDLESSCERLATLAMSIVHKLSKMSQQMPLSIKWILGMLKRAAKQKWPLSQSEERRLISDVLFGCVLSSAIVNPDTHAIIEGGVVIGGVARYNLTQVTAVLQRAAWNMEKQPIQKVIKRMNMEVYSSMLDSLDGGCGEDVPILPTHLPGLKRSSFLASQTQLHNLVGLAASLLTNRDGRGAFHSQMSELLSTLPHTLIDRASTHPYTLTPVTQSLPHKKPRDKRLKKRGSMGTSAHMSTDSSTVPRSRSAGGSLQATLDLSQLGRGDRGTSPPSDTGGSGFMLPTEVLIFPFIEEVPSPTHSQWDFHLLSEEEFMTPGSPAPLTNQIADEDSKHSSPDASIGTSDITIATTPSESPLRLSPAPIGHHVISGGVSVRSMVTDIEGGRLRSNTMPPPKSPGVSTETARGLISEGGTPASSWSPVKGAWLRGGLGLMEEEERVNPYDKLEARDAYLPSTSSSIDSPTSPTDTPTHGADTPTCRTDTPTYGADTPTFNDRATPTIVTSPVEATGEVSHDPEVGVANGEGEPLSDDDNDLLLSREVEPTKKSKKRKKFWPFRKHKSMDSAVKSDRKTRSKSELGTAKVLLEASLTKSRSHSEHGLLEESGSYFKKRRSYTMLIGDITAKYSALNAVRKRQPLLDQGPKSLPASLPKKVERFDSQPPAEMSPTVFRRSLYCDQLKYKLRAALQNIHTPLCVSETCDVCREQLNVLTQQSLQRARWRHDSMEVSLLSELARMIEPLSNELVQVAVDSLYTDYNRRSAYIGYLVKSHQRFQDVKLQVAALQSSIDRLRAVGREVFVGFAVSQFLELRESELKQFKLEMGSLLPADDKCSIMDTRQRTLEEAINNDSTWLCWTDMEGVVSCLDDHLFACVYDHIFYPNGDSDTLRDQIFSEHLTRLADTITVTHKSLQIPAVYHSSCPWTSAQTHLKVMSAYKSPRGKVGCVVRCCKILISLLQLAQCGDPPGADDMFPVIVYVLIKANPPSLLSTIQYIKNFIEIGLSGEDAYWWAQFSTAVEFTKTLE